MAEKNDNYVERMKIFFENQECRIKSCRLNIEHYEKELEITAQLQTIERKQLALCTQAVKQGQKELEEYLAENK